MNGKISEETYIKLKQEYESKLFEFGIAILKIGTRIIPVAKLPQSFGREDFVGIVSDDLLRTISRSEGPGARRFTIDYDYTHDTFVIWDDGSINGTYLNGEDIRGKGKIPLKNGDIISPAEAFDIQFRYEGNAIPEKIHETGYTETDYNRSAAFVLSVVMLAGAGKRDEALEVARSIKDDYYRSVVLRDITRRLDKENKKA